MDFKNPVLEQQHKHYTAHANVSLTPLDATHLKNWFDTVPSPMLEEDTYVNKYIDKNDEMGAESVIDDYWMMLMVTGEMTEQIPTRLFLETKMPMSLLVGKTMSCR